MNDSGTTAPLDVDSLAERLALRLSTQAQFVEALSGAEPEYQDLLYAVAGLGPRFAFDRAGRPAALAAVRAALPVLERELFDAILEDHACEVAAVEEALYRLLCVYRRPRGMQG